MTCPRCQQAVLPDAGFCPDCRAKLASVCRQCDAANTPTHRFCKKYGRSLRAAPGPSQIGGHIGLDVHRAARLCAAGYGGQKLIHLTDVEGSPTWTGPSPAEAAISAATPGDSRAWDFAKYASHPQRS